MIQDKVIDILRGPKSKRKKRSSAVEVSVHQVGDSDYSVCIGSKAVHEHITDLAAAEKLAETTRIKLANRFINAKVHVWVKK